jgi:putative ABC transport system permease protein
MMTLSAVLYLFRARLRARMVLVQDGFAVCGIAIGVALLFASQVASTSLSGSVAQLDKQIVGGAQFQIDSRGPNGFDERLFGRVRGVPGVRAAMPVLEREANVMGPGGQASVDLIGIDPRFTAAGGPLLQHFSARPLTQLNAIALPAPLAHTIGAGALQKVRLQAGNEAVTTLLGITLGQSEIGNAANSPVAIAPIRYAQRLTGMGGRITRIFVRSAPGSGRQVEMALMRLARTNGANLEPGSYDAQLFATAVAPENKSEDLFSAISALVGFMFALNAMLITVPSRRRLIEEVRSEGGTRPMLVQILLFDALVLAVPACVIGLGLGELLSLAVFHTTPGYLSFAFPVGNDRIVTWQSVALAVSAGIAATLVGVLWPLRNIVSDAFGAEAATKSRRWKWTALRISVGLLCLASTTLIPVVQGQGEIIGNVVLVAALVCLLPPLFDGFVALFARLQRPLTTVASALAVVELRTAQTRVRSLAIAVTAAVAVFGAVEFQGIQRNLSNGLDASVQGINSAAQVWVTPSGGANAFATTPFTDSYSRALARLPSVAVVGLYRGGFLDWGQRRLWVLAPPSSSPHPIPVSQIINGDPGLAAVRIQQGGGWAVLSQALASEHHLRVGDAFELPSPRPTVLRVAAVSTNLGWPPGTIIMSAADYARAWNNGDPSAYQIQGRPDTSIATVQSEVRRVLGTRAGFVVETSNERVQRYQAVEAQALSRLTQTRLLVLIAAVLAVTAAMGSMVWQRRNLIASMKVDGYSQAVLWRWLLCESAVLLVTGCSIGAVFGLYGEFLGSRFLASVTGFPIVFQVQAVSALSSLALVSLVAVAVTALPGYLVARVPPRIVSPAY